MTDSQAEPAATTSRTLGRIGFNGKVVRAGAKQACEVCEQTARSGSKMVKIATVNQWVGVCERCVERFYMAVNGVH